MRWKFEGSGESDGERWACTRGKDEDGARRTELCGHEAASPIPYQAAGYVTSSRLLVSIWSQATPAR